MNPWMLFGWSFVADLMVLSYDIFEGRIGIKFEAYYPLTSAAFVLKAMAFSVWCENLRMKK